MRSEFPDRVRYHTDDSIQVKYYQNPVALPDMAAFSLTGDMGCEHGGGVSCAGDSAKGPKQSFLGYMVYNRLWFHKDLYGLTLGGGQINNPGRYLVLLPPDQWCDRSFGHAVFHRESRRSVQSLGRVGHRRLHAEPVHHVPHGVQPPRRQRAVLRADRAALRLREAIRARQGPSCRAGRLIW